MADIGTIVTYKLTADDAQAINRRRDDFDRTQHTGQPWPYGAQAHLGNRASAGDVYPAVVVRNWGGDVNLKVLLDGNDDLWATSRSQGHGQGMWLPANELR